MISWNRPIIRADSGVEVFYHSKDIGPRNGDHGERVMVQDSRGNMLPFYPCGTPMGHYAYIKNRESHKHVVRHRLTSLIRARANQLIDIDLVSLEETEAWGMF